MAVSIPEGLRTRYLGTREGRAWLSELPDRVTAALASLEMELDLPADGVPWHGSGALVVPARSGAHRVVLKFAYPHDEAATEPAALELWNGNAAVRLLAQDPPGTFLVLERLDSGRTLQTEDMETAVAEWGRLVRMLSLPVGDDPAWAAIPSIAERAEQLSDEMPAEWEALGRPFERWLLEAALEVSQVRGAVGRRTSNDVLVHTDLHFANVLYRPGTDGSEGFVAIDPQAMAGEAEFAVAPMLWNRLDALDQRVPEADLRERLHRLCLAAGLDEEAALGWSILREVQNALSYVAEGAASDAQRSLWVASALVGRPHPGLPRVLELPVA